MPQTLNTSLTSSAIIEKLGRFSALVMQHPARFDFSAEEDALAKALRVEMAWYGYGSIADEIGESRCPDCIFGLMFLAWGDGCELMAAACLRASQALAEEFTVLQSAVALRGASTEKLAALGLFQMANRTAEMIDECQSLIQQVDEVMATATIVLDPQDS